MTKVKNTSQLCRGGGSRPNIHTFWGVLPPVMSKIDRFIKSAYVFGGNAFTMVATLGGGGGSEEGCDVYLTFVN